MKKTVMILVALFAIEMAYATTPSTNYRRHRGGLDEGYKGFVSAGYTIGMGDFKIDRLSFNTTHGYQINEMFFAGGGLGFNAFKWGGLKADSFDFSNLCIPIYADGRFNTELSGSIGFFADAKAGIAFFTGKDSDGVYFYFNPSVGLRFDLNGSMGLNVGLGYELLRYSKKEPYFGTISYNLGGLSMKVGLDF